MFEAHIAMSLGFVSLIIGLTFLIWLKKQNEGGFARVVGLLVVVFSLTGLVCTFYYSVRYWKADYFKAPFVMSHDPNMTMNCPMIQGPQNRDEHHP